MRELRPELLALIATGRYGMHTTQDIRLTDGTTIFLSSGEILVNSFGKTQQYRALLDDVQSVQMSMDVEADMESFNITNVDMAIGRTLTTSTRQLDGAQTTIGALFIDPDKPYLPENILWDARMPCQLSSGEVSDQNVDFTATSDVDVINISGRLIAEEFSWREPVSAAPLSDPNDLGPVLGGSGIGGGGILDISGGHGRYGDLDLGHGLLF